MKQEKKAFQFLLILFVLSLVSGLTIAEAKTELTMVTHWDLKNGHGALLAEYVNEYNTLQNDVQVNLITRAGNAEKIILWAVSGTLPDILPISQSFIPDLTQARIITPLPDDVTSTLKSQFLPGALQLSSYNGQVLGYPTENMPNAFTYDTVEFQNKGIGGAFPNTWNELIPVAKKLTTYDSNGMLKKAGIGWAADLRENLGLLFATTWAEGGEVFSSNLRAVNLLSESVQNSIGFLQSIIQTGTVKLSGAYAHTDAAIRWTPGPWVRSSIEKVAGSTRLAEIYSARIPIGKSGKRVVPNYGWCITVPAATKNAKAAHDFLLWLTTERTAKRTTRMGDVLAVLGSIPNTRLDVSYQPLNKEGFLSGFVAAMAENEARAWPIPPNSPAVYTAINTELTAIFQGKKSQTQASSDGQIKTQALIDAALAK